MKLPSHFVRALAALACCMCLGAQASPKWEAVMLNDQGLFYIDPKSITEEDGRKKVWSALDYKKPQSTGDGKPYLSVHSQIQLNCKLKMARVLHVTYYTGPMLTGQVVSRQGMLHEWLDIDPTSPIQKIARRVC
ncbi:surface-adhesin E family protein [Limnohabitans sp. yimb22184]|jgi:hypothetical protein|uniref:surface-adhesin E family protein n=1 Tax=Limnohabitans sp. YIMB22184 TaxID=3374104 RepID=UPI003A8B4AFA